MYCTQDCTCSLCRELRGFKPPKVSSSKLRHTSSDDLRNDNFILRRRLSDLEDQMHQTKVSRPPPPIPSGGANKNHTNNEIVKKKIDHHKVIIYFGDSISNKRQIGGEDKAPTNSDDVVKKSDEKSRVISKVNTSVDDITKKDQGNSDFIRQLKSVLNEKNRSVSTTTVVTVGADNDDDEDATTVVESSATYSAKNSTGDRWKEVPDSALPEFVESIENGVINIRIEENFQRASNLVKTMGMKEGKSARDIEYYENTDESFDWSFVQNWRTR